eukprot:GHVT01089891.1.p2 GENE.GHVT01089891.1~~GHVT01089891.1.p2  ORF type:complete len:691 (+),score=153.00 GHVT01089891.1:286-2358(+)
MPEGRLLPVRGMMLGGEQSDRGISQGWASARVRSLIDSCLHLSSLYDVPLPLRSFDAALDSRLRTRVEHVTGFPGGGTAAPPAGKSSAADPLPAPMAAPLESALSDVVACGPLGGSSAEPPTAENLQRLPPEFWTSPVALLAGRFSPVYVTADALKRAWGQEAGAQPEGAEDAQASHDNPAFRVFLDESLTSTILALVWLDFATRRALQAAHRTAAEGEEYLRPKSNLPEEALAGTSPGGGGATAESAEAQGPERSGAAAKPTADAGAVPEDYSPTVVQIIMNGHLLAQHEFLEPLRAVRRCLLRLRWCLSVIGASKQPVASATEDELRRPETFSESGGAHTPPIASALVFQLAAVLPPMVPSLFAGIDVARSLGIFDGSAVTGDIPVGFQSSLPPPPYGALTTGSLRDWWGSHLKGCLQVCAAVPKDALRRSMNLPPSCSSAAADPQSDGGGNSVEAAGDDLNVLSRTERLLRRWSQDRKYSWAELSLHDLAPSASRSVDASNVFNAGAAEHPQDLSNHKQPLNSPDDEPDATVPFTLVEVASCFDYYGLVPRLLLRGFDVVEEKSRLSNIMEDNELRHSESWAAIHGFSAAQLVLSDQLLLFLQVLGAFDAVPLAASRGPGLALAFAAPSAVELLTHLAENQDSFASKAVAAALPLALATIRTSLASAVTKEDCQLLNEDWRVTRSTG